jgi:hypothetical protein
MSCPDETNEYGDDWIKMSVRLLRFFNPVAYVWGRGAKTAGPIERKKLVFFLNQMFMCDNLCVRLYV